jgi:ubiquinone/menaquinone biosynthesis C-methylase UbiE
MLDVAKGLTSVSKPTVEWKQGQAEAIPLEAQSVDLVFMSQVFHHLAEPRQALKEIARVLTPGGYLAIRNGTREHNSELAWLRFFPEACEIEEQRTPSAEELRDFVCSQSPAEFRMVSHRVIHQLFAASHAEYFEKISQRGLSALIAISDEAFQHGLQQFKRWISLQPSGVAIYEPVDLFTFRKA